MTQTITANLYLSMLREGASRLSENRKAINDLNVFPIPDGDTGDNMYMTLEAGCTEASGSTLSELASSASKGMLLGARGNSGVILSRIFAGIAKGLEGASEAGIALFGEAMAAGVRESYSAVSVPVEGTILTVLREAVESASGETLEEYIDALVREMKASLDRTPELLDVLKEAGVVDSGGAGLLCIFQGMADAVKGVTTAVQGAAAEHKPSVNLDDFGPDTELKFGYCTEFLLRLQTAKVGDVEAFDESPIRDYLNSAGESVVCFRDGSIIKAHVHTMTPGEILNAVQRWGEFLTVKIENMTLQHSGAPAFARRRKPVGVVAVVAGEGLAQAFREAGADEIIEGGQTMNPDARSFVEAFERIEAENIFVFPNNSNVILTAKQAAELYSGAKVVVVPSKDPGAGYVGVASTDFSGKDIVQMEEEAIASVEGVCSGMISAAIRDASKDGVEVRTGDYVGFSKGGILVDSASRTDAALALAEKMDAGSHDVMLLFSGADVSEAEAAELHDRMQKLFPRTEIMLTPGGQPVYDYIITLC